MNSLRYLTAALLIGSGVLTGSVQAQTPKMLNAAHILIQHTESSRAGDDITRTKQEALKLATEVSRLAKAEGADFAALAAKYSDGPSAPRGGDLGNFAPDRMVAPFSAATMKLKIGDVSDPVESQFGYHVILRKDLVEDLHASHILIQHVKSRGVGPDIKLTREEALALATELAQKARAEGADFAKLASSHSQCPSARDGGNLGVFPPGQMIPEFSAATAQLEMGAISDPVETDFGFHVILRKPLPRKVSARHILVQYKGASRAGESITRTKEEAKARLQECIGRLQGGEKFAVLAAEYSDGPSGVRGGDLGEFKEGDMAAAFNEAVFALDVNGVSGIVETPFGYHVILRYK